MTTKEAIGCLECMAIDMTGGIAGLSETSPMTDLLARRIEAINLAQVALRAQQEREATKPLMLEELREMAWEPVFITHSKYGKGWCIIDWHGVNKSWFYFSKTGTSEGMTAVPVTAVTYGEYWLAYRHKPMEITPD